MKGNRKMADEAEVKQDNIYIILESFNSCSYLEKLVNDKILEGYYPQGGVFVKDDRLTYSRQW